MPGTWDLLSLCVKDSRLNRHAWSRQKKRYQELRYLYSRPKSTIYITNLLSFYLLCLIVGTGK